jgi:hydrogenase maturation protease
MGNDSAGLRVLDILEKFCSGLELIEGGTGGIGLLPLIEGADLVIIADAMTGMSENPGDIRVFAETPPYKPSRMSFQDIGVAEVIDIARELNPRTEIIAVGIEAGAIAEYSDRIDPAVMGGVGNAAALIMDIIEEKYN